MTTETNSEIIKKVILQPGTNKEFVYKIGQQITGLINNERKSIGKVTTISRQLDLKLNEYCIEIYLDTQKYATFCGVPYALFYME